MLAPHISLSGGFTLLMVIIILLIFQFARSHGNTDAGTVKISSANFNTKWSEMEISFADDGSAVFTSSNKDKALAADDTFDIYLTRWDAASRSFDEPVNMGYVINSVPDNTEKTRTGMDIEPFISRDGRRLYFSSDRLSDSASSYVGNRIFLSTKGVDGKWSTPKPLPDHINTGYGDMCPTEHDNGQTFCFASQRPGGYGSYDHWCAPILSDGSYGDPVNAGPNVNSNLDDYHFMQHPTEGHVTFSRSTPSGGIELWHAKPDDTGTWREATSLAINVLNDFCPAWTPDGKTMFWGSARPDKLTDGSVPDSFGSTSPDLLFADYPVPLE